MTGSVGKRVRNAIRSVWIGAAGLGCVLLSLSERPVRGEWDLPDFGLLLLASGIVLGVLQHQITGAIFRLRGMSREQAEAAWTKQDADDWPDDGRYKNFMRGKPRTGETAAQKQDAGQGQ